MELGRREVLVGVAATAMGAPLAVGALPRTTQWGSVRRLLDRYVAEQRYAGVAAALSYHGAPISFLSAGALAFDSQIGVTPDSLFRLYSLTKPVTGMAAMLLIEDGTIALDQPVGDVLPELRRMRVAIDPATSLRSRPASRPMTMRQLITHTSGLSNWQPFLGETPISAAYRERGLTPGSYGSHNRLPGYGPQAHGLRALVEGVAEVPLIAEPGTAWNYSMGLDIMGAVIERATGKSLDAFMRERIFEPLRMRSTGFRIAPSQAFRMTTLYERTAGGVSVIDDGATSMWFQPPVLAAGGGGLVSSARDFIRFAAMLLGRGALDRRRVMRAETMALAMSNLLPPGVGYPSTGGFGAGAAIVMPGIVSENGPPGTYSAVGASSTLLVVDPSRRGLAVFLAQLNPRGQPPSVATVYKREFNAAVAADLSR